MDTKRQKRRKKKRIRNLVCICYCSLQLLVVLLAFRFGGDILKKLTTTVSNVVAEYEFSNDTEESEETVQRPIICIDAGHGGKDNGSDYSGRYEKDDNLKIALAMQKYLQDKGITVVMTREKDVFLTLKERCEVANNADADYLICLHRNDGDGKGVETWINSDPTEETQTLAENIMQGLIDVGAQKNRGVKKGTQKGSGDYYVNQHTKMPSCIVELGFVNNDYDNNLFDEYLEQYAAAIGDAVLSTYTTYEAQHTGETGNTESVSDTENVADTETATVTEHTQIDNIEALDATSQDWGLGANTDEWNRPVDAVAAQEKYGDMSALFIGENNQTIYLTFDEGYEYGFTESILDTLKEKNVKAVFFVTEPYAKAQPELVQRIIDEGHVLGNHSVTHPSKGLPSQSLADQKEEVMGNHEYIKENFNYEMRLFRYPTGRFSEQSLALVNNCNYTSVFWSFAYLDYDVNNQPDTAESLAKLKAKIHPGAIYLLHAESETNAKILGDFIDAAEEAGYSFGTL